MTGWRTKQTNYSVFFCIIKVSGTVAINLRAGLRIFWDSVRARWLFWSVLRLCCVSAAISPQSMQKPPAICLSDRKRKRFATRNCLLARPPAVSPAQVPYLRLRADASARYWKMDTPPELFVTLQLDLDFQRIKLFLAAVYCVLRSLVGRYLSEFDSRH